MLVPLAGLYYKIQYARLITHNLCISHTRDGGKLKKNWGKGGGIKYYILSFSRSVLFSILSNMGVLGLCRLFSTVPPALQNCALFFFVNMLYFHDIRTTL